MSSSVASRPMDLGMIFDAAFALYRRHFVAIIGAIGVVVVPLSLVTIALGPVGQAMFVLSSLIAPAIATAIVMDDAAGRRPTIGGVWRVVGPRLLVLLLTALLVGLMVLLGTIALVVPGVLFYVWFAFSSQVVVAERLRFSSAMSRSHDLVRGSWWRVFGILLLAGLTVGLAEVFITLIVDRLVGGSLGTPTGVAAAVIGALTALLVEPIGALIAALLYWDLRNRKEGSDLATSIAALDPWA